MSTFPLSGVFRHTPALTVSDNRGLAVRAVAFLRHPDTPDVCGLRITRHHHDPRGFLTRSADPRLHDAGLANFTWRHALSGAVLRTQGADSGTALALSDAAGRPFIAVSNIRTARDGTEDAGQAVTRTWQYEDATLPGRPLSIAEQVNGGAARITERFVYAGRTAAEQGLNLAGACVSHHDTAGLVRTDSIALTGVPLSVTRRLLKEADNPDVVAGRQGAGVSVRNGLLADGAHTTLTAADAAGAVLATTDAKGNRQRVAYDVAGRVAGRWLTVKGGAEQVIVRSLAYSAAGQTLREEHGSGVVTTYTYEAETQRLTGIKTERPAGHPSGARVLQDLRYGYDPAGNVLSVRNDAEETRFWRNQKVVPESTYAYDSLYRLVRATGREMANAGQQGSHLPAPAVPLPADGAAYTNYTRTYTYDAGDNLTQIRHHAPATGNAYTTNITLSDRSNRGVLSTLTADPADVEALFTAGGQQTQLLPGQALAWNARNELQAVTPVVRDGDRDDRESYRYGAQSQRVLKVSVQKTGSGVQRRRVVYLPGLELRSTHRGDAETERLQVMTAGEAGRAQVRVLHWTSGRPDGISNDQVRYSHDNLTGSSGLEVDGDGRVISMEEYYPYGGTAVWTARSAAEADYRTVRYSGKERDATGLYYYGYRYCQPWSGRWLSADPAGTVDGLNLFRMCRNNPVTLKDSDGRMQEPANQTFSGYIGRDEFSVFDKLLKFPELFYESEDNPSSLAGNIHEENVAEGERSHQKKISVVWGREVTPHFQPKHPSEIAPDGGISLAFIQDISRATYTISFAPADEGMKFTKEDIDKIFSPQAKQVISTIAHQGHLADITIELYGILPVDDMNRFVQKRGNMPEHRIFNEGGQYRITSIKQFEFKNSDTEEYDEISGFTATVEQTTYLDAKGFDGSGNRILSYQSMDKPSFQKISLTMILPENPENQPVVPAGKGFFSRRRNK